MIELGYTDLKLLRKGVTNWLVEKKEFKPTRATNEGSALHYMLAQKDADCDMKPFYDANSTAEDKHGNGYTSIKPDALWALRSMARTYLKEEMEHGYLGYSNIAIEPTYKNTSPCGLYIARAKPDVLLAVWSSQSRSYTCTMTDYKTTRFGYMTPDEARREIFIRDYDLQFAYYSRTLNHTMAPEHTFYYIVWFCKASGIVQSMPVSEEIVEQGRRKLAEADAVIAEWCKDNNQKEFNPGPLAKKYFYEPMLMGWSKKADYGDTEISIEDADIDISEVGF